jgi:CheY-like chemotaxis protein
MSRVLVVEDDAAIRGLVVSLLSDEGHQPDQARDGLEALEKVRQSPPDLVVLDLFMPRMDGYEFLNVSRMLTGFASTPVLVLSAGDQVPADKRIKAFLKKPFDLDLLTKVAASLLDGRSLPGTA